MMLLDAILLFLRLLCNDAELAHRDVRTDAKSPMTRKHIKRAALPFGNEIIYPKSVGRANGWHFIYFAICCQAQEIRKEI